LRSLILAFDARAKVRAAENPLMPSPILDLQSDMAAWRHEIHAHPELAFEEHRTAQLVVEKLEGFGFAVTRGLAGTGVVGTLVGQPGRSAVALRADMDALPIEEAQGLSHRSQVSGRMHACGHDGHVAMLLGAACHLARTRRFAGAVHLIFQPAEENEGGGRVMVEEGLFERFPVKAVFGLHNWPGLEAGAFAFHRGPVMAAFDTFEVVIRGRGGHGAMPHLTADPVVAAAQMVLGFQTIVSRSVSPLDAAVVSVTEVKGGDTWNVIPGSVSLRGTTRSLRPEVREGLIAGIRRVARGVADAAGIEAEVRVHPRYPATINADPETDLAAQAAAEVVGGSRVHRDLPPSMAAEDFAYMLEQRPGCYAWIGNGPSEQDAGLHGAHYDFNDAILSTGASYWVRLVELALPLPD
jgi:hippurate hydrolase